MSKKMKKKQLDWEEIMQDSAEVMIACIKSGTEITTLPALYVQLQKKYSIEGKQIPAQNTYRQEMHRRLNLKSNQRMVKTALYQLAGAYYRFSVEELAKDAVIATSSIDRNCSWLFIQVKRQVSGESTAQKYRMMQKHLYHLSHKLKEEFKDHIIFASFDRDTLVILCKSPNAREAIASYIRQCQEPDASEKKV